MIASPLAMRSPVTIAVVVPAEAMNASPGIVINADCYYGSRGAAAW